MSGGAVLPQDARPLRLVPGYLITPDGRVFKANGKAVRPLSLKEATRAAEAAIEFDRNRLSRQPLGPVQPESLVTTDIALEAIVRADGTVLRQTRPVELTQWVRLPNPSELEPLFKNNGFSVSHAAVSGGVFPAVGDTSRGWYRLEPEGACVLFHGPSAVAHERQSE